MFIIVREMTVSVPSATVPASSRILEAYDVDELVVKLIVHVTKKRVTVVGIEPVKGPKPNHSIPSWAFIIFFFS